MPPTVGHPKCYARALRDCAGPVNDEHYVSKGLLKLIEKGSGEASNFVRVHGLGFLPPNVVTQIGVASLTARILCERHNGLLSRYDSAGQAMFIGAQALDAAAGKPAAPNQVLRVNGDDFERWMLKVMIGGLYSGNFLVTPDSRMKDVCPPKQWLDILFNRVAMPRGVGLYWIPPNPGQILTNGPEVFRLSPLIDDQQDVGGFRAWFFCFGFVLLMARLAVGAPPMFQNAIYRPAGLRAVGSNSQIAFDWLDGAEHPDIVLQYRTPGNP